MVDVNVIKTARCWSELAHGGHGMSMHFSRLATETCFRPNADLFSEP